MRVIATAGHVDHGKSTLVQALTGTDPDRLAEEKQRGLTIDLGFAGMTLLSGEEVAFVDVPGHRRFIGNMLAGLGTAPVVMFVVAADQGWQAQSDEHLDAVAALGLEHGLLVLTRCGLADRSRIDEVRARAFEAIASTSLGDVPVVETDAMTGAGIDELHSAISALVDELPAVEPNGLVRLWVDRSFTIKGAGTVVTGTLGAGTIRVGDVLELNAERVGVRSLQVLGAGVDEVGPVSRVAIGLRGVSRGQSARGSMLRSPGAGDAALVIDVQRVGGHPWSEASAELTVHVGTAAVAAHMRPLGEDHARLTLEQPISTMLGDRFIIRDASAGRIHSGAIVLDISPKKFSRRGDARRRADALAGRTAGDITPLLQDRGAAPTQWLRQIGAGPIPPAGDELDPHGMVEVAGVTVAGQQTSAWCAALKALVERNARDPLSRGVATNVVSRELDVPVVLVGALVRAAGLRIVDGRVVGVGHGASLGSAEGAIQRVRARLSEHPFDAPEADDLATWGLGRREIAAAAERGVVLRLPADPVDIVLLPDAPARAMRVLAGLAQPFTTSEARQALGTTRRVVIPLLEHLDARGWTQREGNARRVVR